MPTHIEVQAYGLGFRLQQAIAATGPARMLIQPALVHAVVIRLVGTIDNAAIGVHYPRQVSDCLQRLKDSSEYFLRVVLRGGDEDSLREAYEHFHGQLRLTEDAIRQSFTGNPGWTALHPWFELGMEIVDGEGDDLPSPGPSLYRRQGWQWSNPVRVATLLDRLAISREAVFPNRDPESLPRIIVDQLPAYWASWTNLEAGLEFLMCEASNSSDDSRDVESSDSRQTARRCFSGAEQEIIGVLRVNQQRMTTRQILGYLAEQGITRSEGVTKQLLGALVRAGDLTNRQDVEPNGYGLPEWDLSG